MSFDPQPILLEGRHVRLEPMRPDHAEALFAAGQDPLIWKYLPVAQPTHVEEMASLIREALRAQDSGTEVPYVTVRTTDGQVVGTTRFIDIRRPHRGLEIGWTWIRREAQRSAINTEAKYLMLDQAFEGWGAMRVQLKTDARNEQSRAAILRIGGKFEGILRKQMLRGHDGYQRDSAMFSIIDTEWPGVKVALEAKLGIT